MTFSSADNTVRITGLDRFPELTIVGPYSTFTGEYRGIGSTTLSNGLAVTSEIAHDPQGRPLIVGETGPGQFAINSESKAIFYGLLTRRERDSAGTLLCTRTYWFQGVHN